jgi:tyrosyl-tRNA synthetase
MENILDYLQKRDLIEDTTSKDLRNLLSKPIKFYIGFDPTSDSLHLGNLVGIIVLEWFKRFKHLPFALIGGATARIGDPSGKSIERPLLSDDEISYNVKSLTGFFKRLFPGEIVSIVNNDLWYNNLSVIAFLRDIGKQFRIGPMLSKESVKLRFRSDDGMSFTEFSYQVLQGYDFYHLFEKDDVLLQIGGSDQWGNITSGIELIRKKCRKVAYGITFPLLLGSDGKKFGKSEKGAIWLNSEKLSVYDFYQYLIRVADEDVIKLLKMLTFLELSEIEKIKLDMKKADYVPNTAQRILAENVTKFVHSFEDLKSAQKAATSIYASSKTELNGAILKQISKDIPHEIYQIDKILGKKLTEVAVIVGICSSKSEALRLLRSGGTYVNNQRILDENFTLSSDDLIEEKYILIGVGKKKKQLIELHI